MLSKVGMGEGGVVGSGVGWPFSSFRGDSSDGVEVSTGVVAVGSVEAMADVSLGPASFVNQDCVDCRNLSF